MHRFLFAFLTLRVSRDRGAKDNNHAVTRVHLFVARVFFHERCEGRTSTPRYDAAGVMNRQVETEGCAHG